MSILNIRSEKEYQEIAAKIEAIKNAEPGTSKAILLKLLVKTIVQHERQVRATAYSHYVLN